MNVKLCSVIALTLAFFSAGVMAAPAEYKPQCNEGTTDIFKRAKCLNDNGYKLLVITKKIPDNQTITGKSWFKLYTFDGKDITPPVKVLDKHFKGSIPTYELVDNEIHQFTILDEIGEFEDQPENLCISARTGKKVKCRY